MEKRWDAEALGKNGVLKQLKVKYTFLDNLLQNGYGSGNSLFEICEFDGVEKRTEDCFISGCHNSGSEFVSWRWDGIKNNLLVNTSSYKTVRDLLRTTSIDYLLCEEVLTIERTEETYTDRSILIYKIDGVLPK
jgi:hypothetical protein